MSVQVNIRLDDESAEQLDKLAAEDGTSRAAIVREAVLEMVKRKHEERIAAQYRQAYAEVPETTEELAQAERNARRYVEEEPWEKWW